MRPESRIFKEVDTVIIGGGVMGAFIGYELAKRGIKAAIVEQKGLASGATGAAAGMLASACEHFEHPELAKLARKSRNLFPSVVAELKRWSGIDPELVGHGFIVPALNVVEAEALAQTVKEGDSAEWWGTCTLRKREPKLGRHLAGALYYSDELQVNPRRLTQALAFSSQALGAELVLDTHVLSISEQNGRVNGVYTDRGFVRGRSVIVAGGYRMGRLLEPLGLELPLYPVKGEIVELFSEAPILHHTLYSKSVYIVPKVGGRIWLGATSKPGDTTSAVSAGSVMKLIAAAEAYLPGVGDCEYVRSWSGHRPQTPDGLPYIGAVSRLPGLYLAGGHYRNGILLSAVTASLLADELQGQQLPQSVKDLLSPDRLRLGGTARSMEEVHT